MKYEHKKKEVMNRIQRVDISEYIRTFLLELSKLESSPTKINTWFEATRIKGLLNIPKNTRFKSLTDMRTGFPYWDEQMVDYVPSNLGNKRGYIFYFICNGCEKRVKYLYEYDTLSSPLCRTCCRITYKRMAPSDLRKIL